MVLIKETTFWKPFMSISPSCCLGAESIVIKPSNSSVKICCCRVHKLLAMQNVTKNSVPAVMDSSVTLPACSCLLSSLKLYFFVFMCRHFCSSEDEFLYRFFYHTAIFSSRVTPRIWLVSTSGLDCSLLFLLDRESFA
ncbi:hypothetical protein NC651_036655 [Populus alba x Populus x berolinensis]|nr:hypothetical protein NC651_036655 [Populus alba x Populus x berolinensis]